MALLAYLLIIDDNLLTSTISKYLLIFSILQQILNFNYQSLILRDSLKGVIRYRNDLIKVLRKLYTKSFILFIVGLFYSSIYFQLTNNEVLFISVIIIFQAVNIIYENFYQGRKNIICILLTFYKNLIFSNICCI